MHRLFYLFLLFMASCGDAVHPSPTPPATPPMMRRPAPPLSKAGESLIIEFEVGGKAGYRTHPEAPDARYSGVTWGIGYDGHANSVAVILIDWRPLGVPPSQRLAATHPYYGRSAQVHLRDVGDIIIPWMRAYEVFTRVDVAREYASCKKTFPGFEQLRPNAQAALMSLTFNRGASLAGPNRTEMRKIRDLVPKKNYSAIAGEFRSMVRVWRGTSIFNGMQRRRLAEAKLVEMA